MKKSMISKAEAGKKVGGSSAGDRRLLTEIEAISKALYVDKKPPLNSISRSSSRSESAGRNYLTESKSKVKNDGEQTSQKEKKSIWNWRPLKALSQIRNRRFNCCFTLQVHSIEGLPPSFDDLSLCVHWKRQDGRLVTRPAKVIQGVAEFEENLMHTCSVYGSRSGPHHSAKYEAKHFLLYVAASDAPEADFGKHRVDLTRLLPLTLEELEEDKNSGKWTTSFRLTGKANGATLNVSFEYMVIADNATACRGKQQTIADALKLRQKGSNPMCESGESNVRNPMRRTGSLPVQYRQHYPASSSCLEEIKDLHEVLPVSKSELANTMDMLDLQSVEEKSVCSTNSNVEAGASSGANQLIKSALQSLHDCNKQGEETECTVDEFPVIEQGLELSSKEDVKSEVVLTDTTDVAMVESHDAVNTNVNLMHWLDPEAAPGDNESLVSQNALPDHDCVSKDDDMCSKESLMKELELALESVAAIDSPSDQEDYLEFDDCQISREGKSLSLDDTTECVESEFLDMLAVENSPFGKSSESEPESPRERLLRQFEKESLAGGFSLFDFSADDGEFAESGFEAANVAEFLKDSADFEFPLAATQAADKQQQPAARSKTKAAILEDLETEALMREWGLNEKAFKASPCNSPSGFGSPFHLPPEEEPIELPPLADGLGPYLQTNNGGFLRSMTPSLFRNAKNNGSLIMQASSPLVLPAEMGSDVTEILQSLASVGMEKLSMQANKLMPLEDITGKTMNQVAMEASLSLEGTERHHGSDVGQDVVFGHEKGKNRKYSSRSGKRTPSSIGNELGAEYVSIEDLAPLALDKIEALSMEGLRIQSGMSNEDAPSNISAKSIGEISTFQGKGVNMSGRTTLGLDGTAGLQLLDIKESSDDVDGLMGLSLSLNEWMKLDSGELDDGDDQISERTSKILAAHQANSLNWIRGGGGGGSRRRGKGSSRKCGLLGNNFTVALMVQLRDPLRNYEHVGAPMLALIQVERVFVPQKPTIFRNVSQVVNNSEDEEEVLELTRKDVIEEENVLPQEEAVEQFKITEVHVAGLKTDPGKKKLWGTKSQQQSGSRWLLANGMGKNNKHPLMKSKQVSETTSTDKAPAKEQSGDTLWSISSRAHGDGSKWKEITKQKPHTRNPNILLPKATARFR